VPTITPTNDGEPVTNDGKPVQTITSAYAREIYYTRQPQLPEIKKAMTQMVSRLSGEVPLAIDLSWSAVDLSWSAVDLS